MSKYNAGDKVLIEIEKIEKNAYEKGMEDAWEIAKEIVCEMTHITYVDLQKIFDLSRVRKNADVIKNLTPQKAKEKLESWKNRIEEIKVNDVVKFQSGIDEYVVIEIYHEGESNEEIYLYKITGSECFRVQRAKRTSLKRTGKELNIRHVLSVIGCGSNGSEQ